MRPLARLVLAAVVIATGPVISACDSLDTLELWDAKKKLPGDRKQVFPEGVPGVATGVPPEIVRGYREPEQAPSDPARAAAEAAAAEQAPKPKPAPKPQRTAAKPKPPPDPYAAATPPPAPARAAPARAAAAPAQASAPASAATAQPAAPWPSGPQAAQPQQQAPWPGTVTR